MYTYSKQTATRVSFMSYLHFAIGEVNLPPAPYSTRMNEISYDMQYTRNIVSRTCRKRKKWQQRSAQTYKSRTVKNIKAKLPHIDDCSRHEARSLLPLEASLMELDKYLVSRHAVSSAGPVLNNRELDALDDSFEDCDSPMPGDTKHARDSAKVDGADGAGLRLPRVPHDWVAIVVALRELDDRGPVAHPESVPVEDETGWRRALAEEIDRGRCRVPAVVL